MMYEKRKWAGILNDLWQRNYYVSSFYRRAMETITHPGLKQKFLKSATNRAQLAFELSQQIARLDGTSLKFNKADLHKKGPIISLNLPLENLQRILEKCEHLERESIREYSRALTQINEGRSREVLIRHRKLLETGIKELKSFESFGRFTDFPEGNLRTN